MWRRFLAAQSGHHAKRKALLIVVERIGRCTTPATSVTHTVVHQVGCFPKTEKSPRLLRAITTRVTHSGPMSSATFCSRTRMRLRRHMLSGMPAVAVYDAAAQVLASVAARMSTTMGTSGRRLSTVGLLCVRVRHLLGLLAVPPPRPCAPASQSDDMSGMCPSPVLRLPASTSCAPAQRRGPVHELVRQLGGRRDLQQGEVDPIFHSEAGLRAHARWAADRAGRGFPGGFGESGAPQSGG